MRIRSAYSLEFHVNETVGIVAYPSAIEAVREVDRVRAAGRRVDRIKRNETVIGEADLRDDAHRDGRQAMPTLATFTVKLTIDDADQLIAAGRRAVMAASYSKEEADRIVKEVDFHAALAWCLIPAPDIVPGVDIVDSFSEMAS